MGGLQDILVTHLHNILLQCAKKKQCQRTAYTMSLNYITYLGWGVHPAGACSKWGGVPHPATSSMLTSHGMAGSRPRPLYAQPCLMQHREFFFTSTKPWGSAHPQPSSGAHSLSVQTMLAVARGGSYKSSSQDRLWATPVYSQHQNCTQRISFQWQQQHSPKIQRHLSACPGCSKLLLERSKSPQNSLFCPECLVYTLNNFLEWT